MISGTVSGTVVKADNSRNGQKHASRDGLPRKPASACAARATWGYDNPPGRPWHGSRCYLQHHAACTSPTGPRAHGASNGPAHGPDGSTATATGSTAAASPATAPTDAPATTAAASALVTALGLLSPLGPVRDAYTNAAAAAAYGSTAAATHSPAEQSPCAAYNVATHAVPSHSTAATTSASAHE